MSDLPEGVVALLLTEVEGSTGRWERDAAAMAAVCARLDELVATTVRRHGGHVVKPRGEGDSHFTVFADPADAVLCAAGLQRELASVDPGLRLRIACHVDAVELRDGDYYGPMVNCCARLRAAANGGQVLLSAAMASATVRAVDAEGYRLVDLGLHRLRGLQGPERVFQLDHPATAATFPGLATMGAPVVDLGLPLTTFVGRATDADALIDAVGSHRVVVVTGAPGVGKTRLALEVMAARGAAVTVVDLGGEPDAVTVLSSPPEHDGFLVLDDADHVLDHIGERLPACLDANPSLTVLVTTRSRRLSCAGVDLAGVHLAPLGPEDAAQLVVHRLPAVLDEVSATDLEALASACAGLPLVIELAMPRLLVLSPAQLVERLAADPVRTLKPARGQAPRAVHHRSWGDAVTWSLGAGDVGDAADLLELGLAEPGPPPFVLPPVAAALGR